MKVHLNIGCGPDYIASDNEHKWVNADISKNVKADSYFDAFVVPYPFESNTFDHIKAYDFIEHIPHVVFDENGNHVTRDGFFVIMEEFWRILKPGGILEARFPAAGHVNNFIDPTHCRQIFPQTFTYYFHKGAYHSYYTDKYWNLDKWDTSEGYNHKAFVRKVVE